MSRTAVIAGVGPGFGESIARKFASEGCNVVLFARSKNYIGQLEDELKEPGDGLALQTDLTEVDQIRASFEIAREEFGPIDILVNHASTASWKGLQDLSVEEFERSWAVTGRGAFICSQEAVSDMLESGSGTILFTGATSSVRSLGGAIGFTAAKFAAKGMAMDMAQEFGPEGIHVAHVIIDGQIDAPSARNESAGMKSNTFLDPDKMAETYWHLVEQDKASTQLSEVHITNGPQNTEFI